MLKYTLIALLSLSLGACNPLSIFSTHKDSKEPKTLGVSVSTTNHKEVPKPQVHPKNPKVLKKPKPKVHLKKRAATKKPLSFSARQKQIIKDCKPDFFKTNCVAHMPNRKAVEQCMISHKADLAPICSRHLPR